MTEPKDAAQPTDAVEKTASKAAKAAPKRKGMWSTGSGDTSGYGGIEREIYRPTPSQRPFGGWFDEVVDRLIELVDGVSDDMVVIDRDEMTIHLRAEHLLDAVKTLRDDAHLRFETCVSVSGVHYPEQAGAELHVVYHLLSMTHNRRLRLEVACPEEQPHVPSVVATYPMADWHERETWDMFGIIFDGHPSLTRILMPDDWQGHPQRKDYPLGGVGIEYKGAVVPPVDERRKYL